MDRKIGRNIGISIFCVLTSASSFAQHLKLSVTDKYGKETQQVTAGAPFKLVVDMVHEQHGDYTPKLQLPQGCSIVDTAPRMIQIREVGRGMQAMRRFIFMLNCDTIGPVTLGPVIFEGQHMSLVSDTITIEVSAPDTTIDERAPVFLRAVPKKQQVYVGEKVPFTVSFYSRLPYADEFNLDITSNSNHDTFKLIQVSEPVQSTQQLARGEYNVATWNFSVVPLMPGNRVIPAISGSFNEWASFFSYQRRRSIESNPVQLEVKPLPPYDKPVDGVGTFSSFSAKVDRSMLEVGQPLVLKIWLTGQADFDAISQLRLSIPEHIRYFSSAGRSMHAGDQETKMFEYVLQPKEAGQWILDAQVFTYFDPEVEQYKTIKTQSIEITVHPSTAPVTPLPQEPSTKEDQKNTVSQEYAIPDVLSLPIHPQRKPALPAWCMILCCLGSLMAGVWPIVQSGSRRFITTSYRYHRAFARARRQLKQAERNQDTSQLYGIFTRMYSARGVLESSSMISESIPQLLQHKGMPVDTCRAWENFLRVVLEHHYSPRKVYDGTLFNDARQWINELEKYI